MDSYIAWIGGKKLLRKEILKRFPSDKIDRYIEPFTGAGWVFFAKDKHAKLEVINDIDSNLINLYRCVKFHPEALQTELQYCMISREEFEDCKAQIDSRGLTDIQRAARYYLMIQASFGANRRSFCVSSRNLPKSIEYLQEVSKRLQCAAIEHKDFENLIKCYDRQGALFYCDPPYYKTESYYDCDFSEKDHIRLRDALSSIKGKFLLTYNDCDFIRQLYSGFYIEGISRSNNLSSGQYKEIIIRNYNNAI